MQHFFRLTILLCVLGLNQLALADTAIIQPNPPSIQADAYILMDAHSKAVILEKNAHKRLPPASLTKIMTSYIAAYELALGNISHADQVPISVTAWRKPGSRMFIREGTTVQLSNLLRGMIIQSGNDASIAIAEHIAGSESAFADLMNEHAKELGMENTHFVNATGWPGETHLTTAFDMALLTQALITQFTQHYRFYSEKSFTFNNITQKNRNILLSRDPNVDGVKTGYTQEAGYCLVTSALKDGMRLITVVMGAAGPNSRATQSQKLLSYGFRFYQTVIPHTNHETMQTRELWFGQQETVQLSLAEDIVLTVPRSQADKLETQLDYPEVIRAPISANQTLGTARILLDGEILHESDLIALTDIKRAGFFTRLWHHILLFFR